VRSIAEAATIRTRRTSHVYGPLPPLVEVKGRATGRVASRRDRAIVENCALDGTQALKGRFFDFRDRHKAAWPPGPHPILAEPSARTRSCSGRPACQFGASNAEWPGRLLQMKLGFVRFPRVVKDSRRTTRDLIAIGLVESPCRPALVRLSLVSERPAPGLFAPTC